MSLIDDQLVLRIERLRDDVHALKDDLRARYPNKAKQVVSPNMREQAASVAERWLVEVAGRPDVASALGANELADRSVLFQQLLTHSERATLRHKYDTTINGILKDFRGAIVVPLKARRSQEGSPPVPVQQVQPISQARVAFIGQSFQTTDASLNATVARSLEALGLTVHTGEKPRAASVSKKVRDRIDRSDVFVGIFSRRDKLADKPEWTTSSWVVDEKAYALAKGKKLVLLREEGVGSLGGLQGDYEYLEFSRSRLEDLVIRLVETFLNRED
jgi:hypothetical protein